MFKKNHPLLPLTHYLPFQFKNGTVIRQFSKPCLHCNTLIHSEHMHGLIRPVDNWVALAARAKCPACHLQFNIACIISDQKSIRRVHLPAWLFRWYLQLSPASKRMPAATASPFSAAQISPTPVPPSLVEVTFPRATETVGQYNGKPIPAYIIVDGEHIPFSYIAANRAEMKENEYLIDEYLVYSKQPYSK